jgi:Domain of unknown function (DUF5615)
MLLLAADENFNGNIVRGLLRRQPALDIVRLQDVGLLGADDPRVLEWAAQEGRVLLTHDVSTMTRYEYDRVQEGHPMPGVFEISRDLPIGRAIDEILLLAKCSLEGKWEGPVRYLPLR